MQPRAKRALGEKGQSLPISTDQNLPYRAMGLHRFSRLCSRRALGLTALVINSAKRFVYIIRSIEHQEKRYIGVTSDMMARLSAHNAGQNRSTAQ